MNDVERITPELRRYWIQHNLPDFRNQVADDLIRLAAKIRRGDVTLSQIESLLLNMPHGSPFNRLSSHFLSVGKIKRYTGHE